MTSYSIIPIVQKLNFLRYEHSSPNYAGYPPVEKTWTSGASWSITNMFGSYEKVSTPFFDLSLGDFEIPEDSEDSISWGSWRKNYKEFGLRINRIAGTSYGPDQFYFKTGGQELQFIDFKIPSNSVGKATRGKMNYVRQDQGYTASPSTLIVYFIRAGRIISELTINLYFSINYDYNGGYYRVLQSGFYFKQYSSSSYQKFDPQLSLSSPATTISTSPRIQIQCSTDI